MGQKVQVREVICQFASFCVLDSSEQEVITTLSSLFFFFFSVKLCCSRKEEIILETSYLQSVPKTQAPPPRQPVEGGRCWDRCGVLRCLDPRRTSPGTAALGTQLEPGQKRGLSPRDHPYPNTFSQAVSRARKTVTELSL